MTWPRNNVATAVGAVALLAALGTVGYRIIEGWSWFDSLYMTIITLATIGYGEPEGMTRAGRVFTVVLISGGVLTVGYAVTVVTQSAIQGELLATWEKRRVQERIRKLKDHFIICGIGRVGKRVAAGLASEDADFVLVERDRVRIEGIADTNWLVVHGDATREDVLERAGIHHARGLVAALPTDADNVFIVLTARDLSETLKIVARVNDNSTIPKMRKAGADKIISPLDTGAHLILQALLRPSVAKFIELATMTEGLDLTIEEVLVSPGSPLAGKKLREANLRRDLNVIIISIVRAKGEMIFNPNADTAVDGGDKIIAIGNRSGLEGLEELAEPARTKAT
jgi:voltage-gated potassium channel